MFSRRLAAGLQPNRLALAVDQARVAGRLRIDLTTTNPTAVGLPYPAGMTTVLADARGLVYEPAPFGTAEARAAVAAFTGLPADRLVLTASTSEAYGFLFKLLCDPGDAILAPRPSYPLFDLLSALEGVELTAYRLDADGGWCIDRSSLERALSSRTRAVIVVSPNNPTGSRLRAAEREWLVDLARRYRLALVSDEVFADYLFADRPDAASLAGESRVLTFTLGGLSKAVGLPQMKLAWTGVSGPDDDVREALARLEIIADSYLSVAAPVQVAAGRLLEAGAAVRRSIRLRLERNLQALRAVVAAMPALTLYEPEGGWSAVVRVPAIRTEEEWVIGLLDEYGVLVHPGWFFDLDTGTHLVVSLLPPPETFDAGVRSIADAAARWGA